MTLEALCAVSRRHRDDETQCKPVSVCSRDTLASHCVDLVSQEHESAGGAQFSWSQLVGTSSQNRKRQRPNDPNDPDAHGLRRTRTDDGKERAKNQTSTDGSSPRTPLPSTGTKCSCNGLQATDDNPSEQAIDTKALYTANKEEIEHCYDEDF